jgi:hypothetical protein
MPFPVINAGNTARLVRQQRRDDQPFPVRQFVSPPRHQTSIAMESLNHASQKTSRPFMSLRPSTTLADSLTPLLVANPFSAMRTSLRRWSSDEFEDGVAHGW